MWEYKVVTGTFSVDGVNVFIENPAGKGTLQQALDHYGTERWELVSTHLDGVLREAVLVLKRPRAGGIPVAIPGVAGVVPIAVPPGSIAPVAAGPAAKTFVDPDGEVVRRRAPGSPPAAPRSAPGAPPLAAPSAPASAPPSGGRRRSKADLDKLARDD